MQLFLSRVDARLGWMILASALAAFAPLAATGQETLPAPIIGTPAAPEVVNPSSEYGDAELVAEVRIVGNLTTTTTQIAGNITTRAGRPFEMAMVQRDVSKLANLGWFVDVKALYEKTPQGRIVIFQVVERPTIRYVTYLGNEEVKKKTLTKQTGLKAGGSVDPYAVQEGARKLRDYYMSKGYN
ncbi:MAG TPA: POTRA domain-containing protein, partial [Lacipirellula sp.]